MSVEEKQARSVFVGNIPHGTTEEQMKEYFSDVGTVLSFRIVYDRETGNPKGYGFAEYMDTEMAQSAIRNLNGREFNGRVLRVDKASSQADELRMIHQQTGGPPVENPYGEHVPPEKAPEAISKAVASLPPEQMFELMKQMKACIQNNPNEARTMLLQNPQLAYALLQAQVIMRIVDPNVAQALLHRMPEQVAPIMPIGAQMMPRVPIGGAGAAMRPTVQPVITQTMPLLQSQPPIVAPQIPVRPVMNVSIQPPQPQSLIRPEPLIDPRFQGANIPNRPVGQGPTVGIPQAPSINVPPRQAPPPMVPTALLKPSVGQPQQQQQQQQPGIAQPQAQSSTADQEKAALIMQVLQLRDDQIAMLPAEQRQSILLLKEQIAQSAGGLLP